MKAKLRPVKTGQVWEFLGDTLTPHYGMCLVLRESAHDPELHPGSHHCLLLSDEGNSWGGEGKVVQLWLSTSNWKPLEC